MERLRTALGAREALLAGGQTNVARLFNSAVDGIDGLVIEKLGEALIVQLHEGRLRLSEDALRELCTRAAEKVGARAVYRKVFPRDRTQPQQVLDELHHDAEPWLGETLPEEFAVREDGVSFLVHPYDGYATGLFLDHRVTRAGVRKLAAGRRVLNGFAYTCGFTVAAALGGAASTVSVDVSRKYLEWGKRNLAVNGVDLEPHRFICSDIFDYYRRAERQGHRFDLLILDPPTFARMKKPRRTFALSEDLGRLVAEGLALLEPRGHVYLSANHRGTSLGQLERAMEDGARANGRSCEIVERGLVGEDFAGDPEQGKCVLARVS